MSIGQELVTQITELLSEARLSQENLKIERCALGGNNRTYRVETSAGVFAAKQYFNHSADNRDRLGVEFSFLTYAQKVAEDLVPRPYAQNSLNKMALYEFIQGQPLTENEITETEVNEAIDFFCRLNEPRSRAQAAHLANASEACFSIEDHFALIGARIKQIQQITPDSEESGKAQYCAEKLDIFWSNVVDQTQEIARKEGFDLADPLDQDQHCLSPSDFGFHNALRVPGSRIRFLDFEYAGWDDPAKMAGDFFAQIAVPVPEKFFEDFLHKTMASFSRSEQLIRRAKILRVGYQVKWCCIALNIFLPYHLARRKFANENLDVRLLQHTQLSKAQRIMRSLKLLED